MKRRPLGRTGVQVSPLILGSADFGTRVSPDEAAAIVGRALDAGINVIDTASGYGRWEGRLGASEETIGKILRTNGRRGEVYVATKASLGNTRHGILKECRDSLARLQTDYIDLYQLHFPSPDIPTDETLRALDDLVRAGDVRYVGVCNHRAWEVVEAIWVAKELKICRYVTEQSGYSLLDRRIEREMVSMAESYGLGLIPFSPLAGGLLSGKYAQGTPPAIDTRYGSSLPYPYGTRSLSDGVFSAIDQLRLIADALDVSLATLAIAWCIQQPGITASIFGARTIAQLDDFIAASEFVIPDESLALINKVVPPGSMTVSPSVSFGARSHRVIA